MKSDNDIYANIGFIICLVSVLIALISLAFDLSYYPYIMAVGYGLFLLCMLISFIRYLILSKDKTIDKK